MPYVVTFLVLLSVLSLFNLLLSLGLVRRLREDSAQKTAESAGPQVMHAAGERVGAFRAVATDGAVLSDDLLRGAPTLVGAFAQGCPECEERLPLFAEYAAGFQGGPEHVVAVLVGDPDELRDKVAMLEPVARVSLEDRDGPVGSALGVRGYPAFGVLDDQAVVQASGVLLKHITGTPTSA